MTSQALVIVQFGDQYQQEFKNDMAGKTTLLKGNKGRCLGFSSQVDLLEGGWPAGRAMGVLLFASERDALMWLDSDTMVKQADWLHGADIVIVPTLRCPAEDRPLLQICDAHIHDLKTYMDQYVAGHLPELEQKGGFNLVAASTNIRNRGLWQPDFLVVNQWRNSCEFFSWYKSADYQDKWEQYGLESAVTDMVIVQLQPLVDVESRQRHEIPTPY